MTEPPLTAALRACANGLYPAEAACELLIATSWLDRRDFRDGFINTGVSFTDGTTPMADIDWAAAIAAVNAGRLPCCGGERRILRIAGSLGEGVPVDLHDALPGLDDANIRLVVRAVQHAAGRRPACQP